jgi:hypothetical protein
VQPGTRFTLIHASVISVNLRVHIFCNSCIFVWLFELCSHTLQFSRSLTGILTRGMIIRWVCFSTLQCVHCFLLPYIYSNVPYTGPSGDLRVYLERLSSADDVQVFVQDNPFGQPSITESDPNWKFYAKIVDEVERAREALG